MKKKQVTATVLAAILAAGLPGTVYGAGPSGVETTQSGIAYGGPSGTEGMDPEKAAALEDNRMEYWELGDLIENYNVTYKNTKSQIVSASQDLGSARELREEAGELMIEAGELRSEGLDETTRLLYDNYKATAKELRKQAQKITNSEMASSAQKQLRRAKNQLTYMAQQLMIGYHKAYANQDLINKSMELSAAMLDSVNRQAALSMKSRDEVQAAEQTYKQAENSTASFNSQLQSVKQNLQMVTGWNHDANAEICPIPEPDLVRIDGMNPQNDLQAAIGTNYDLQDIRSASATGSSARGVKKRSISQAEQDLASTLQSLYASVISGKQNYEGALAEFEAASQIMQGADLRNSMGMMGRLEYLNAQVAYLTAKSAKDTAALDLFSAMETYDWALKGFVATSEGGR